MKTTGFPSPANDHLEQALKLDEYFIPHPSATFFMRAGQLPLHPAGIRAGDLLIVDRSVPPQCGHHVVAIEEGLLVVQHLVAVRQPVEVWGVITHFVRTLTLD